MIFTLSSAPGLHRPWLAIARSRRVTLLHHSLSIVNLKIMPNRLENVKESVDKSGYILVIIYLQPKVVARFADKRK